MAVYEVMHALVLRETLSREADKILTVLTAEKGKITVIARGARRKNSRVAAASELFAYSEMTAYENHGYMMLTEASTIELFSGLRQDVLLLSLAGYLAELTESIVGEGEDAEEILRLLLNALYALGTLKKNPQQVKAAFEMRLLAYAGFSPLLEHCMHCGKSVEEGAALDVFGGGVLCADCARGKNVKCLTPAVLAALRYSVFADAKKLYAFAVDDAVVEELSNISERYVTAQLDRRFSSLDFYHSMRTSGVAYIHSNEDINHDNNV